MKSYPKVSVITTIYGVEAFIAKCLDSLINQSYKNLEIICVNDGTKDKSMEIVESFAKRDNRIVIVNNKENLGLFRARVEGMKVASGDYFSFVDADDFVSLDWFRLLVKNIVEKNADMVIGNTVTVDENNRKFYYNNQKSFTRSHKDICGDDVLKAFYEAEGSCYAWHTMWNKIYSRELIEKCLPYFEMVDFHLIMIEDIAFSSVFYTHARKLSFADIDCYFYYRHSGASTSSSLPYEKMVKNARDVGNAFRFVKDALVKYDEALFNKYQPLYERYKQRYRRIWTTQAASLGFDAKREMKDALTQAFGSCDIVPHLEHDFYFYELTTDWNDRFEYIKKLIASREIQIVSFDIFDTLVKRPFYEPSDLFLIVGKFAHSLFPFITEDSFKRMRIAAESEARRRIKRQDILLSDIYDSFSDIYKLPREEVKKIEEREIECELKYCTARLSAKELYEYASHIGKRIIITSDMYLPKEVVKKILDKNGYTLHEELYLSSDIGLLKSSGDLYKHVLNDTGVKAKRILHIGDTWQSDIIQAGKNGITTHFFPKALEVYKNGIADIYTGNGGIEFVGKMHSIQDTLATVEQLPTKCAIGLMANKMFDYPYTVFKQGSSYNADSYYMGYSSLGMHVYGMAEWMYQVAKNEGYKKIVFLARDGKMVKEVFDMLCTLRGSDIKTEYFYATRKALMPYSIRSASDLFNINQFVGVYHMTPRKILSMFSSVLKPLTKEMEKQYRDLGVLLDEKMCNESEIYSFIRAIIEVSFDEELLNKAWAEARVAFGKIFDEGTATFDAGYSGRLQSIICDLAGHAVNTFYIHSNGYNTSSKTEGRFKIHSYYDYTPAISSIVREFFMSDPTPSCYAYKIEGERVVPLLEKWTESFNCDCLYAITETQKGAVDFCRDYIEVFGDIGEDFVARRGDYACAFDHMLLNASDFDRSTFSSAVVEDEVYSGYNKGNMYIEWNKRVAPLVRIEGNTGIVCEPLTYYEVMLSGASKYKKFFFLLLFDRALLKSKVKPRLKRHKLLYGMCKLFYKALRKIYRLFRH